ncbi:MATE family efflux transporter [Salidesulfovibrio onnuriiensis]|uniref:MATE family efflux transporter n=1 Tax=Salidesulfovibrio onnuriiensis TaxID=2583823 RepID=UPI0011CB1786|nr:MATE family efflux transporter [Salidesulfovibrio onnuriiensis]
MSEKDKRIRLLSEGKVSTVLLKLGLPTIIGMLISALYNVVDAYFISWLGPSQMAAVSIVFPVVQVVIGLGLTFGTGAASCISRYMGDGNMFAANKTASSAIFSSIAAGAAITIVSLFFCEELLIALGASETILPYAKSYFTVYMLFATVGVCYIAMNNVVISEGAARMSMLVMLLGGILNILLDPVFIFMFRLGVYGAAVATVISQISMLAIFIWYFSSSRANVEIAPRHIAFEKKVYLDVLKIGLPMFAFQLLSGVSMGMTNTAISEYGDAAVASIGIALRILALVSYVIFGFVKGFQPLAGYSYGAGNYGRLKESTAAALKWTGGYCAVVALSLCFFNHEIMGLFSHGDMNIVQIGGSVLLCNGAVFILFGFFMVYSTLFLALGKAREGMILNLSRQGIFFIPAILTLPGIFGMDGVIYSQPVAEVLSFALAFLLFIPLKRALDGHAGATAFAPDHGV